MKITTSLSAQLILLFFCFFTLGSLYSQGQKTTKKTLFGKPITAKSKNRRIRAVSSREKPKKTH
jgi:hypothetical protein